MKASTRSAAYVAPAIIWVLAFFVVPFVVMACLSFARLEGRLVVTGLFFDNYIRFFSEAALFKSLIVSLEITVTVTVISVLLAYPCLLYTSPSPRDS